MEITRKTLQQITASGAVVGAFALGLQNPTAAHAEQSTDQTTAAKTSGLKLGERAVKRVSRAAITHFTKDLLTEEARTGLETTVQGDDTLTLSGPVTEGVPLTTFVYRAKANGVGKVTVFESTRDNLKSPNPTNGISIRVNLPVNNLIGKKLESGLGLEVTGSDVAAALDDDVNVYELEKSTVRNDTARKVRTIVFRQGQDPLYTVVQGLSLATMVANEAQLLHAASAIEDADSNLSAQAVNDV